MLLSPQRSQTQQKPFIDVQEAGRAFKLLSKPGYVYEIRCLEAMLRGDRLPYAKPRTINGYFDNAEKLVAALQQIASADGVYIIANPCQPALLAHTNNRFRDKKTKCAQDDEIAARHWMLLDLDPEREGGIKGIPTTDAESKIAADFAQTIRAWLTGHGWPEPIEIDSGNGRYLVLAIDQPANDNGLVQRSLNGLAQQLNTAQIHVDTTTYNQARLMRLPGTMNCKGDGTEDRPHRMAKIISAPDEIRPVPIELLEAIAVDTEQGQPKQAQRPKSTSASHKKDKQPPDYLDEWNVTYGPSEPYKGGQKWALTDGCPFCGNNDHNVYVYLASDGKLGFKCSHNSCAGLKWQDLRLHFEPDAYDRQGSMDWKSKSYGPTPSSEEAYWNDEPAQPSLDTVLQRMAENEWGDALLFAEIFQDRIVYDASNKEWYYWNEHYWKLDSTSYVRQLVSGHLGSVYMKAAAEVNVKRAEVASAISNLQKDSDKIKGLKEEQDTLDDQMDALKKRCYALRGAKRCLAVLGFVQTDPRIAVTGDCWDRDKWVLPVLNGVIDLHTGIHRPGRPRDYIRTVAPVKWKGLNSQCPRFVRFLNEIFEDRPENERQELIAFLKRLLGYAITGLSEKAIFPILYGEKGRNGKDTLLGLIKAILGPLAGAVSNDLFIASKTARPAGSATPHVCDLQGKRIVWGSETEQGDKLNISQIKQFTGGGDIPARQNYGKQYSFPPTHTLFLMTNYKPHADADDEAFWTRACLIEFKMRFLAPDEVEREYDRPQDETLKTALMGELSGILAWLVNGCLDYQKQGFCQPLSVRMATTDYRKSEDQLQLFIDQCCYVGEKCFVKAKQVYEAYRAWCFENQHSCMNNKLFSDKFGKRFKKGRKEEGIIYQGVGLIVPNTPFDPVGTVGKKANPVGTNQHPTGPSEPASEAASDRCHKDQSCRDVGNSLKVPPIVPRESDFLPLFTNSLHPYSQDDTNVPINPLVEPSEGVLYDEARPYSHPTGDYSHPTGEKISITSLLEAFWSVGKQHNYPEISDLGLKSGKMEWNSFSLSRRLRIPDVISRLGH